MTTIVEVKYISRNRAEYLMGALGLKGGTLISGIGVERLMVVQPVGSDIADGPIVARDEALRIMDRIERFFGDCGADMDAIQTARKRLAQITIGQRVEAGREGTEDYDSGKVIDIDGDTLTVAWDSGVRTQIDVAEVR